MGNPAASKKKKDEKMKAKAFINWKIFRTDGSAYRGDKGFSIFQNPEYPSKGEDLLVQLAEQNGGKVRLNMEVEVRINTPAEPEDIGNIAIIAEPAA